MKNNNRKRLNLYTLGQRIAVRGLLSVGLCVICPVNVLAVPGVVELSKLAFVGALGLSASVSSYQNLPNTGNPRSTVSPGGDRSLLRSSDCREDLHNALSLIVKSSGKEENIMEQVYQAEGECYPMDLSSYIFSPYSRENAQTVADEMLRILAACPPPVPYVLVTHKNERKAFLVSIETEPRGVHVRQVPFDTPCSSRENPISIAAPPPSGVVVDKEVESLEGVAVRRLQEDTTDKNVLKEKKEALKEFKDALQAAKKTLQNKKDGLQSPEKDQVQDVIEMVDVSIRKVDREINGVDNNMQSV